MTLLDVAHVIRFREQLIKDLPQALVRYGGVCHLICPLSQSVHVLSGHLKALLRFHQLGADIAHMSHAPRPLCRVQGEVQGIIADHPNRGHADADSAGTVMGVGEADIRLCLISADFGIGQLCQQPDLLAVQQAARCLVVDIATNQGIREGKCIRVLHNAVLVADNAQHLVVRAAHIRLVAGNRLITAIQPHIAGLNRPVKTGQTQGISAGGRFLHHRSQTVPRLLADIEHRFNICRHISYLQKLLCCAVAPATIPVKSPGWFRLLPGSHHQAGQ